MICIDPLPQALSSKYGLNHVINSVIKLKCNPHCHRTNNDDMYPYIPSKLLSSCIRKTIIHIGGDLPIPNEVSNSCFEVPEGFI